MYAAALQVAEKVTQFSLCSLHTFSCCINWLVRILTHTAQSEELKIILLHLTDEWLPAS